MDNNDRLEQGDNTTNDNFAAQGVKMTDTDNITDSVIDEDVDGTNSSNGVNKVTNDVCSVSKPVKNIVKAPRIQSAYKFGKIMGQKSFKRAKRQLENTINVKRKRPAEEEEEEDFNFGSPYVVLTQDDGKPITCYMVPKETNSTVDQYVATSTESVIKPQALNSNEIPVNFDSEKVSSSKSPINPQLDVPVIGLNDDLTSLEVPVSNQNLPLPVSTKTSSSLLSSPITKRNKSPTSKLGIKVHSPVSLAPLQPKPNQIQITMIDPKATTSSLQIITKTLTKAEAPFKSVTTQEPTFPVRQVLPKLKKEAVNPAHFLETQKFLMEKIKSLKAELNDTKWKLNDHEKRILYVKILEEKLVDKRRQIKTMCTQRKRLSKRLDSCRQELEKTRRALELVESQAVLWNNANMSELGKLIFGLHTVTSKKCMDAKVVAAKAPPEVKGFVISLYMTSPKAYQLVRDCFNGLPHPKTVAKWLHGDRVESTEVPPPKQPVQVNNAALEETFSRVIESEEPPEVTTVQIEEPPQEQQGTVQIETENVPAEPEIVQEENATAIYYVLDEKGNVTGQLSSSEADILFSAQGLDLESVPHHEIVITE